MKSTAYTYRSGRIIAALFTVLGWLGLGLALPFAIYSVAKMSPGGVETLPPVLAALLCILLGQIGRAVFDMAERRTSTGH